MQAIKASGKISLSDTLLIASGLAALGVNCIGVYRILVGLLVLSTFLLSRALTICANQNPCPSIIEFRSQRKDTPAMITTIPSDFYTQGCLMRVYFRDGNVEGTLATGRVLNPQETSKNLEVAVYDFRREFENVNKQVFGSGVVPNVRKRVYLMPFKSLTEEEMKSLYEEIE